MKVIIEGIESEVSKVVRENSIRVRRGLISITPLTDEAEVDSKDVEGNDSKETETADSKESEATDSKEVNIEDPKKLKTTKSRKG